MGLRQSDLEFTVDPVFEIDSYKSKMGDDEDIVVLSFSVNGEQPAKDLVNFVETGYNFVLDADKTSGEQADKKYRVFIEMERNRRVPMQILEILDGIKKLTNMFIGELKKFSNDLNSYNSKKLLTKLQKTKNIRNRIVKAKQAGKFIPND